MNAHRKKATPNRTVPSQLILHICVQVAGLTQAFPSANQAMHISVYLTARNDYAVLMESWWLWACAGDLLAYWWRSGTTFSLHEHAKIPKAFSNTSRPAWPNNHRLTCARSRESICIKRQCAQTPQRAWERCSSIAQHPACAKPWPIAL